MLNSLDGRAAPYQAGDQIVISGTDADGTAVNTTLAVGPASTLNDLVSAINGAFTKSTASIDASGNLVVKSNTTGPSSLSLGLADAGGNVGSTNLGNHVLADTVTGKDGDTVNTSVQVFDSRGTAHDLSLTFQKQADGSWNLAAAINPQEGTMISAAVTGIQFNDDGSFRQVAGGAPSISFQIAGLAAPQTVTLSPGATNSFSGITQFGGATSAAATNQDGFAAGFLSSLSVGQDGVVSGIFTNGQTLAIAQLATASFANPEGLNRVGNNYYTPSADSGEPQIGAAGSAGRGTIQAGSLEASNVDVSAEFTRLIAAAAGLSGERPHHHRRRRRDAIPRQHHSIVMKRRWPASLGTESGGRKPPSSLYCLRPEPESGGLRPPLPIPRRYRNAVSRGCAGRAGEPQNLPILISPTFLTALRATT